MSKIFRVVLFLILFTLTTSLSMTDLEAVTVIKREDAGFDTQLLKQEEKYGLPGTIMVTTIFMDLEENVTDLEWLQGLYYYQSTRLNFGDFTYHYIVLPNGQIYKGNAKGEDQRLNVDTSLEAPIIIGYLARSKETDFQDVAKSSIEKLILEIANRQSIPIDNVTVKNMNFEVNRENLVVAKANDILTGRWNGSMESIKTNIKPQYMASSKNLDLIVEKITLPSEAVKYGDNVIVKITLKNNSESVLYQGSDSEPLVSKESGDISKFYVNDVWLSLTQAAIMPDKALLKPGASAEYQLRVSIPLYFGEQTERFKLINSLGQPFYNSSFDIKLNVLRPDKEIIEITETGAGYLKVRANPSGSAEVTTRVSTTQRFIVLERSSAGWVKIDLGNGQSGWVAQQYTKRV